MESNLTCSLCGARPFSHRRALSTYQLTCIGNKRPRQEQYHDYIFNDRTIDLGESSGAPESEAEEPIHQELELEVDDVLDSEFGEFAYNQTSKYLYDSTFSLVNWARTIKRGEGLSNNAIDRLFSEVLLHPNFNIKDLTVKSAFDIDKYERSLYTEADGWRREEIDSYVLRYRDPLIALESLYSAPQVEENFTLTPSPCADNQEDRIYSTPATGDWWHAMQVRFCRILLCFFKISSTKLIFGIK
jgi:hypothetical protein